MYGDEHPDVASSLNALALLLVRRGKRREARKLGREALRINRKMLGSKHPDTKNTHEIWGTFSESTVRKYCIILVIFLFLGFIVLVIVNVGRSASLVEDYLGLVIFLSVPLLLFIIAFCVSYRRSPTLPPCI